MDKVNANYCYYFLPNSYMFKLRIFSLSFGSSCLSVQDGLICWEVAFKYSSHN